MSSLLRIPSNRLTDTDRTTTSIVIVFVCLFFYFIFFSYFFSDDHLRLRRHAGHAVESHATKRRQGGRFALPGEREQTAGQVEHGVRHGQEEGSDQVRRMAESTFRCPNQPTTPPLKSRSRGGRGDSDVCVCARDGGFGDTVYTVLTCWSSNKPCAYAGFSRYRSEQMFPFVREPAGHSSFIVCRVLKLLFRIWFAAVTRHSSS